MKLSVHLLLSTVFLFSCGLFANAETKTTYHSLAEMPTYGTLVPDAETRYTRLPDSLQSKIRPDLWNLGQNSAGMAIRFRTASPSVKARWHARFLNNMNHMTATGIRGLDVYVLDDNNNWTYMNSCRPDFYNKNSETTVMSGMEPRMREYMLYLPLYDGVDSLYIGTDSEYAVLPPAIDLPRKGKPVVMYGTSILQGGCATRPGMAHTNILERMLQQEVVNLGFSGNGRLDYEVAEIIADNDASVIVIDALPNVNVQEIDDKMINFIQIIRKKHPDTPMVLVETPMFTLSRFKNESLKYLTEQNEHLDAIYQYLKDEGDDNLYIFRSEGILDGQTETTVDEYHFTDMGFKIFAENMYPMLRELLDKQGL